MITDPSAAAVDPNPQVAPEPSATAGATGSVIVDQGRADRAPPSAAPAPERGADAGGGGQVSPVAAPPKDFVLRGVEIAGGTAPDRIMRPVMRRFAGRRLNAAALTSLAQAISAAYARSDVALYTVIVPDQTFARGIVKVTVIEGWIESVSVKSRDGRRSPLIEAYARRLLREHPLRKSSFDHQLLLMRSLPGVTVDVAMEAGSKPGAVRMRVTAATRRHQLGAGVGDRGTHLLGRTQIEADLTLNSLLRQGDRTSLVFQTSTDFNRYRYVAASHAEPIGHSGVVVQGSLGYLTTHPKIQQISGSQTEGSAKIASLQVSWPAILRNDRNLYLSASLDGVDSANALLGQRITDEKVRAVRGSAAYAQALDATTSISLGVTFSQGLPGLGARPAGPGVSDEDFRKVSIQGAATKSHGRWTVRARAQAQETADRLPSSEMLSLGGDDYGRAFPTAVVTGDSGEAGSLELAYALGKTLHLPKAVEGAEAYAFADAGRTDLHARPELGVADHSYELASAGVGVRVPAPFTSHGALQLEASHELVANLPGAPDKDWRLVFGYRQSY